MVNDGSGLRCALNPVGGAPGPGWEVAHLRVRQLAEVGRDVEEDALLGPGERHSSEEQDDQHDVGIRGREVDHLGGKGAKGYAPSSAPMLSLTTLPTSLPVVALGLVPIHLPPGSLPGFLTCSSWPLF